MCVRACERACCEKLTEMLCLDDQTLDLRSKWSRLELTVSYQYHNLVVDGELWLLR